MGKKQKKAAGENAANEGGENIDSLAAEMEAAGAAVKQAKGKKEKASSQSHLDEDDDDITVPPKPETKIRKVKKGRQDEECDEEEGHDMEKNKRSLPSASIASNAEESHPIGSKAEGAHPIGSNAEGSPSPQAKAKRGADKATDQKKKGQSKATVKHILEMQARRREEEERARREEEEERRRCEERERLEQEQKEKKKQKATEKKERQKKEGTLVNKAQRKDRARAEASLKQLQAQGFDVPSRDGGSVPNKKPVYGDKRKKMPVETSEGTSPLSESPEPIAMETKETVSTPVEILDNPLIELDDSDEDNWEALASDDEKETSTPAHRSRSIPPGDGSKEEGSSYEPNEKEKNNGAVEKSRGGQQVSRRGNTSEEESSTSDSNDVRTMKKKAEKLRAPVLCVMGHVDTGKTKILDRLRNTRVQDGEAGGITQQIGATNVPLDAIVEQTKMVKRFDRDDIRIPGMVIIDTPGHESFRNLRSRGSSLCDIAILVVDIMHGLQQETLESIRLLKEKRCPFVVALNKIDRLYGWKKSPETDVRAALKKQKRNVTNEFERRVNAIVVAFQEQGLNTALFHENTDPRRFVSLVPTSAHSGDGIGNLMALLVELTQTRLAEALAHRQDQLRAQVMEVKVVPGLGTTLDVILINGRLREGDTIVVPGLDGAIVTQIRSLLLPPPMKELRVTSQHYEKHKEVSASRGVKVLGKNLDRALAGLPLLVARSDDEIPALREELNKLVTDTMNAITFKKEKIGVYVQASTLGSLEALMNHLHTNKVPYSGYNVGPVHKSDVTNASAMLEHDAHYAVILAFDVKVERGCQEMADQLGVKVFSEDIMEHLCVAFNAYRDAYKKAKREEFKNNAVFPVKLKILPQYIIRSKHPIVMGVSVEAGELRPGTPLCVPSRGLLDIGVVLSIEANGKRVDFAKRGAEVCVKIEPVPGESPKEYGRHFEAADSVVSRITRESMDALGSWFGDDMQPSYWQLVEELKGTFGII